MFPGRPAPVIGGNCAASGSGRHPRVALIGERWPARSGALRALETVQKVCRDSGLRSLSVFPVPTSGATPLGKRLRLGAVPGGGLAAYGPAPPPARAPQDPFQTLRGKHLGAPPLRAEPLRPLGQESRAGGSLPQPDARPPPFTLTAGWRAHAKEKGMRP